MGEQARVIGMMPVDLRVQGVALAIIDDVVELQGALSSLGLNQAGLVTLRNIQVQARSLLTGNQTPPVPVGDIAGGYRLDALDVLQTLAETLCCDRATAEMSDDDLRLIAMAAEAAHTRINNYLQVQRMENLMRRKAKEGESDGLEKPAA
ncbi:MAG: hypothetical protein ACOY3Z_06315 [Thermodesulfobacteriota bacterium]